MPAPSPLCKTLLRHARDGAGAVTLKAIRDTAMSSVADNGRVMVSASGAGKAYTFLNAYPTERIIEALDEAEATYAELDADQLSSLLDRRPIRKTIARFC